MSTKTRTRFQPVLDEIVATLRLQLGQGGTVASYIPALARVDARQFGIALRTCDGEEAGAGDFDTPFSIQSVSKLFTLTLAMQRMGDALWERIGREPSGNPFNSLVQLEKQAVAGLSAAERSLLRALLQRVDTNLRRLAGDEPPEH